MNTPRRTHSHQPPPAHREKSPQAPVRGRFAPSPTGDMHLGNASTALLAWLQIRSLGGAFVLRMEDLDPDRSRPHFAAQILSDLRWLGLDWDEGPDVGGPAGPYRQSERRDRYRAALAQLATQGAAYPCYCSRADILRAAAAPHPAEEGPRYPGTCRPATAQILGGAPPTPGAGPGPLGARRADPTGHPLTPAWRLVVPPGPVPYEDEVLGPTEIDVAAITGDFVIWRREDVAAYQLAVVVDDAAMGITHVLRAADLVDSTPRQILLDRALGLPVPRFAHVPLLVGPDGQRLAKRHGSVSIRQLREAGATPEGVTGFLAHAMGLLPAPTPVRPVDLVSGFDLARLLRQPVTVNPAAVQRGEFPASTACPATGMNASASRSVDAGLTGLDGASTPGGDLG